MANPAITRDTVHELAEACSEAGDSFQSTAARLIKEQRKLSRYFEDNIGTLGPMNAQVALYMLAVSIRVLQQVGGRLRKASGSDLNGATTRIQAVVDSLLPADEGFADRARAIEWRAQPHLLDEILWALYERPAEDKKEEEVDIPHGESALIYLLLWTAVEALDANWVPPRDWQP
jgi:hypothetical protein